MQADGGSIVLNRFEKFILRDESICQIVVRVKVVWLRSECGIQIWYGFADSPRGQERSSQGIIGGCILWAKTRHEIEGLGHSGMGAREFEAGGGGVVRFEAAVVFFQAVWGSRYS